MCPKLSLQQDPQPFSEISFTARVPSGPFASIRTLLKCQLVFSSSIRSLNPLDPCSLCFPHLCTGYINVPEKDGAQLVPVASSDQFSVTLKSKCHSLKLALYHLTSLTTAGSLGHSPEWYFHLFSRWRPWRSEIFVDGSKVGQVASAWTAFCYPEEMALSNHLFRAFLYLTLLPRTNILTPRCTPAPWTSIKPPWSWLPDRNHQDHQIQGLWFAFSQDHHSVPGEAHSSHQRSRRMLIFIMFLLVSKAKQFVS